MTENQWPIMKERSRLADWNSREHHDASVDGACETRPSFLEKGRLNRLLIDSGYPPASTMFSVR
jgi:hypothetical protein